MESTVLTELEILTSKYAGGDEILKEMYQLTDQGGRALGLSYDLTIPFTKVISLNPQIKLPYKRYEIGKVFRDGPTKRGRLREFLQCDVDVVGVSGLEAEAELMQLAIDVFQMLDINIILRWNNRLLLSEWLEAVGVPKDQLLSVIVGLSFGIESITALLEERNKELCTTPVVIISFGNSVAESLHYASLLRAENIRVRLDTSQRKLRKLLPALRLL